MPQNILDFFSRSQTTIRQAPSITQERTGLDHAATALREGLRHLAPAVDRLRHVDEILMFSEPEGMSAPYSARVAAGV